MLAKVQIKEADELEKLLEEHHKLLRELRKSALRITAKRMELEIIINRPAVQEPSGEELALNREANSDFGIVWNDPDSGTVL